MKGNTRTVSPEVVIISTSSPKKEVKSENGLDSEVALLRKMVDRKSIEMRERELELFAAIRRLKAEKAALRTENDRQKAENAKLRSELEKARSQNDSAATAQHKRKKVDTIAISDNSDDEQMSLEYLVNNGGPISTSNGSNYDADGGVSDRRRSKILLSPPRFPPRSQSPHKNLDLDPNDALLTLDDRNSGDDRPTAGGSRTESERPVKREDTPSFEEPESLMRPLVDDKIEVKVKMEDGRDEFKYVSFTKSEDGMLDIWNLDGFNLGPPLKLEDHFKRGFSRKVISDAFGGGHQECFHHWNRKMHADKTPYVTFNRTWNPELPHEPGQHGIVFCSFHTFTDGTPVNRAIPFFVCEGRNKWVLKGIYNVKLWGEISPSHIKLVPRPALQKWIKGALKSQWGELWVARCNKEVRENATRLNKTFKKIEYTEQGLWDGLESGKLIIDFTIMQCVGYKLEWFDKLLYAEEHPKPPKTMSPKKSGKRKRPGTTEKNTPLKKRNGRGRGKPGLGALSDESDEESEEDGSDDDELESDESSGVEEVHKIAPLRRRVSKRITRETSLEI